MWHFTALSQSLDLMLFSLSFTIGMPSTLNSISGFLCLSIQGPRGPPGMPGVAGYSGWSEWAGWVSVQSGNWSKSFCHFANNKILFRGLGAKQGVIIERWRQQRENGKSWRLHDFYYFFFFLGGGGMVTPCLIILTSRWIGCESLQGSVDFQQLLQDGIGLWDL